MMKQQNRHHFNLTGKADCGNQKIYYFRLDSHDSAMCNAARTVVTV